MTETKKVWETVRAMNIDQTFTLGPVNAESLLKDPKHLLFTLSRYKFAAKILRDKKHIVEVGCGEGLGAFMFLAETGARFTGIDFDEKQIGYACANVLPCTQGRAQFFNKDLIADKLEIEAADGLVSLDVIEHISPAEEMSFITNLARCLAPKGIAVIGTPNKDAEQHASARSKQGHINLFDGQRLRDTLKHLFEDVLLFSMNDEMVHTGFTKMAHYLMAVCINRR